MYIDDKHLSQNRRKTDAARFIWNSGKRDNNINYLSWQSHRKRSKSFNDLTTSLHFDIERWIRQSKVEDNDVDLFAKKVYGKNEENAVLVIQRMYRLVKMRKHYARIVHHVRDRGSQESLWNRTNHQLPSTEGLCLSPREMVSPIMEVGKLICILV